MKEIIKIVNDLFYNELNLRTEARRVGDKDTAKIHDTNAFRLLMALGELYDVRDGKSAGREVEKCNLASISGLLPNDYEIKNKAIELSKDCDNRHDQIVCENAIVKFANWLLSNDR